MVPSVRAPIVAYPRYPGGKRQKPGRKSDFRTSWSVDTMPMRAP